MFREAGRRSKRQLSPSVALDPDYFVAFPRIVPIPPVRVRAALRLAATLCFARPKGRSDDAQSSSSNSHSLWRASNSVRGMPRIG